MSFRTKAGAVFAAVALLAACGGDSDDTTADETPGTQSAASGGETAEEAAAPGDVECAPLESTETITIGTSSSLSMGTPPLAEGAGYYADNNLQVEPTHFPSGQDTIALLGRGQLDAAVTGISANYFNALQAGLEVWVVGSQGYQNPDDMASGFYARSDLVEDGTVDGPEDLAGMTIAFPGVVGSAASYYAGLVLQQGGLTFDDVEQVSMTYADMPIAFENRSVDAAWVGSPFAAELERTGVGQTLGDQSAFLRQDVAVILLGPNLLTERPDVGCAFLRAHIQAARDLLGPGYSENDEAVAHFVEIGDYPEDLVRATAEYLYDEDLALNPDSLAAMQEFYISEGVVEFDEPMPFEDIVAVDFRDAVLASLDG